VRPLARLLLAVAFASGPAAFAIASCGTDAENVEPCRQIEGARCEIAPACAAGFDVEACTRFYNDACLVGTASTDAGDVSALVAPCISALKACAAADASAELGCPGQALAGDSGVLCKDLAGKALDPTPCNIVMQCPEALAACAWVAKPADADAGGDAGGGDAGGGGGTGGMGTGGMGTGGMGTGGMGTGGTGSTGTGGNDTGGTGTGGSG
jgi:hypothetical protein